MKNVKELRAISSKLVKDLQNDKVGYKTANVIIRAMNTSISSAKVQVVHNKAVGKRGKIAFLSE